MSVYTCVACRRSVPLDDCVLRCTRTGRAYCLACFTRDQAGGESVRAGLVQRLIDALERQAAAE